LGTPVADPSESRFSAGSFLAGQAAAAVSERVGTLFGFDRLRITPPEGGTGGAGVTVGKRLSKTVVVTYTEQSVTTEEQRLLRVEWQVDQNLTLIFSSGTENSFRVDARWERRF
jgi:autotransporter translocation and assembly factor TamB